MNHLKKTISQKTVPLSTFSQQFNSQQKQVVADEIRYYDVLIALRNARKQLGFTQQKLAHKAHLPRTTITKIESGRYNATLNTLMAMASAMNKTLQVKVV